MLLDDQIVKTQSMRASPYIGAEEGRQHQPGGALRFLQLTLALTAISKLSVAALRCLHPAPKRQQT
jgi:hypothetical protein